MKARENLESSPIFLQRVYQKQVDLAQSRQELEWAIKLLLDGLEHLPVVKQFGIMLAIQNTLDMVAPQSEVD